MTSENQDDKDLINYRLSRIDDTLEAMAKNLERLTTLELRHATTREEIDKVVKAVNSHDHRIKAVEIEMPMLKTIKGWVVGAVLFMVAMVGAAVIKMILNA